MSLAEYVMLGHEVGSNSQGISWMDQSLGTLTPSSLHGCIYSNRSKSLYVTQRKAPCYTSPLCFADCLGSPPPLLFLGSLPPWRCNSLPILKRVLGLVTNCMTNLPVSPFDQNYSAIRFRDVQTHNKIR